MKEGTVQSPWSEKVVLQWNLERSKEGLERVAYVYTFTAWKDGPGGELIKELNLLIKFNHKIDMVEQFVGDESRGSGAKAWMGRKSLWTGSHKYDLKNLPSDRPYRLKVIDLEPSAEQLQLSQAPIWIKGNIDDPCNTELLRV